MSTGYISDPSRIIKIGDKIHVRVSGFNENYQIKLAAPEFKAAHTGEARPAMRPDDSSRATFSRFDSRQRPPRPRR